MPQAPKAAVAAPKAAVAAPKAAVALKTFMYKEKSDSKRIEILAGKPVTGLSTKAMKELRDEKLIA